ncbi:bifunctional adenosylcobinamide kinase/adenosylcobinamide-phosphate guanylyltransferase [Solwaraspora sp. WMMB335]|uniref:bifunctional adenosylcobinamide kinase/adenosylcobinamide-phosphate guanylyltransferase n=1 Tax=Solwaraspora sp. WMMB335 TaxID=3404118 RepID=UPI003B93AE90
MSVDGWRTVLVLGGIRSGKSRYAESLLAGATAVRYVATGATDPDDPHWSARIAAHRQRRPQAWHTDEVATHPAQLVELLTAAGEDETLLVDDLGGWVTLLLDPARQPADDQATIAELATAVRSCAARLVLVSPEVGLALVATTPVGRAFADALGTTNQAVAKVCDTVVLVLAGQPLRLKPADDAAGPADGPALGAAAREPSAAGEPSGEVPTTAATATTGNGRQPASTPPGTQPPPITPGMKLPMPVERTRKASGERLRRLDQPGAGFGALERVVAFAATVQDTPTPQPWDAVQVMVVHGDHAGGVAAGDSAAEAARRAAQVRAGQGPLAHLAAAAGAAVTVVDAPAAAAIEDGPALDDAGVETALATGWQLAEQAGRTGTQLIVLAACGCGAAGAAAAVLAATTGAEPAGLLGRVPAPGGLIDDNAWMSRCAAVRDALRRTRRGTRSAREVLSQYGGGDIAVATGVLLGAAANRIPVLLDGPVGVAAALVTRDLAGQVRHWCLLPDHGHQPTVKHAADVLGLAPVVDLRLDLGEGTAALTALPLLRSVLALAGALGEHPALAEPDTGQAAAEPVDHEPVDVVEPEPVGPGPASNAPAR